MTAAFVGGASGVSGLETAALQALTEHGKKWFFWMNCSLVMSGLQERMLSSEAAAIFHFSWHIGVK